MFFCLFFSYQGSRNLTCYCGKQGFNFFLSDFFYFLLWKAMLSSTILLGSYFWFFTNLCEFLSWMLHLLYTFAIFGKGHTAHARRRLKLLMRTVYMMYMMIAQLAKIVFKTEYSPPPPSNLTSMSFNIFIWHSSRFGIFCLFDWSAWDDINTVHKS